MADLIFNSFKEFMADGTIDLDTHTFKAMLLADTYTPNALNSLLADLAANEIGGAGYTAGGATLANVTWNRSGGTVTFDANDVQWAAASFTARYLVIYADTPAGDPLVCLFDFGSNQTVTNGTFTFQFNASGIIALT